MVYVRIYAHEMVIVFGLLIVYFDVAWQDLVKKAVSLAIARDGASGGVVRTVIVRHLDH